MAVFSSTASNLALEAMRDESLSLKLDVCACYEEVILGLYAFKGAPTGVSLIYFGTAVFGDLRTRNPNVDFLYRAGAYPI